MIIRPTKFWKLCSSCCLGKLQPLLIDSYGLADSSYLSLFLSVVIATAFPLQNRGIDVRLMLSDFEGFTRKGCRVIRIPRFS